MLGNKTWRFQIGVSCSVGKSACLCDVRTIEPGKWRKSDWVNHSSGVERMDKTLELSVAHFIEGAELTLDLFFNKPLL